MELHANYTINYLQDFIGESAKRQEKTIIFLRSTGWNNSTDVDAINASRELYKTRISLDIWTDLTQSEYVFIACDNTEEAFDFCEDVFPASQAACTRPEDYIFYAIYGPNGQLLSDNE